MCLKALENLVERTRDLKREARSNQEINGLLRSARTRLADAKSASLSIDSRFDLAYNAAHAASLAALRWHGYRPDRKRYIVFQCLAHTLHMPPEHWRVLDLCHHRRNLAEYQGELEVDETLVRDLIRVTELVVSGVVELIET